MQKTDYIKELSEIRSMMERSSRFISLSGLSGVMAGLYALLGALVAYQILGEYHSGPIKDQTTTIRYLLIDASLVFLLAFGTGILLTTRRAHQQGLKVWDATARRLLINLLFPLGAGGLFLLILLFHGYVSILAPGMLIFYGLSLINASKYTLTDIRYLGIAEIILGLVAAIVMSKGLLWWTLGFGVLHIAYGTIMYYKYER